MEPQRKRPFAKMLGGGSELGKTKDGPTHEGKQGGGES